MILSKFRELFLIIRTDVFSYCAGIPTPSYSFKSGRELVTIADTDINEIITGHIIKLYPDHNIVSEEGNGNVSNSPYCWYIDPIDNSVGFLAGETEVSVSISLKHQDEHIHSMVINPRTGEVFEACDGVSLLNEGAALGTYKGSLNELTRGISTCAYVTKSRIDLAKDVIGRIFEARLPLRISGGSAFDLCRVAEGKSFAHVCLGAHTWDVEAGIHMLINAGGAVEILETFPERDALSFIGACSRDVLGELRSLLKL